MLSLITEKNLRKEKIAFFNYYANFINLNMPDKIKSYISSFMISDQVEDFTLDHDDLLFLEDIACDKNLFYSVIYVCLRRLNYHWNDFFDYIKSSFQNNVLKTTAPMFYQENEFNEQYRIRQCRPDKKEITFNNIVNIGLYNKNQNFSYVCYDNDMAKEYIRQELGENILKAYNHLTLPQSQSDFFLIASLYNEGGVSADVCSVAQANIEILIRDSDFVLISGDYGIDKKFIFAKKHNEFIKYYLKNLVEKSVQDGVDQDYLKFSSREIFQKDFLDFFAFRYDYIQQLKLTFIDNNIFTAFVRADGLEEVLFQDKTALVTKEEKFSKVCIRGQIKKNPSFTSSLFQTDYVVRTFDDYYMPSSNNLISVGEKQDLSLILKNRSAYSIASLNVWKVNNVCLSGHAALWKDHQFLDLESYLSNVAENETRGGFWKIPSLDNITDVIKEECIIAFSAGYGCYGHYLVDDLPRLGLIKDALGNDFFNKKLIISHRTPEWAKNLLKFFLGASDDQFLVFNHEQEVWKLENVYLSSFPHKDYNFHGYIKEFYSRFSKKDVKPFRRICLSRGGWKIGQKHTRIFKRQELFEKMAIERGFEIVYPEKLPLEEQIKLLSETSCQIGEHGSAQHASVYNAYGNMIIGTLNPQTEVQSALGRIYNDKNIVCHSHIYHTDNDSNLHYDISLNTLLQFFNKIEEYEKLQK